MVGLPVQVLRRTRARRPGLCAADAGPESFENRLRDCGDITGVNERAGASHPRASSSLPALSLERGQECRRRAAAASPTTCMHPACYFPRACGHAVAASDVDSAAPLCPAPGLQPSRYVINSNPRVTLTTLGPYVWARNNSYRPQCSLHVNRSVK